VGEESTVTDREIESLLYKGLKSFLASDVSEEKFISVNKGKLSEGRADHLVRLEKQAVYAMFFALADHSALQSLCDSGMGIRLGGLVSLFHDAVITIGAFSLLDGWLPFSLSVDQSFIAAILTVVGYSIMDTVVVFDRIRGICAPASKQKRS